MKRSDLHTLQRNTEIWTVWHESCGGMLCERIVTERAEFVHLACLVCKERFIIHTTKTEGEGNETETVQGVKRRKCYRSKYPKSSGGEEGNATSGGKI